MSGVTTLEPLLRPLMDAPSVETPCCAVCGRPSPLNRHHIVQRSAGEVYRDGKRLEKPTVVLCGYGNNLRDAQGRPYCHGLAHHRMLHFRWVAGEGAHLEFLVTREPTKYSEALAMGGWRRLRRWRF